MTNLIFNTPEQMKVFAAKLANKLIADKTEIKSAKIINLYGNLGSGKTTFTQGFGRGLGITRHIQSPTFVLMRRYKLPKIKSGYLKYFYHLDLYRIKDERDVTYLALNEIFQDPTAVILIEWAERIENILPDEAIKIRFEHIKNKNKRKIILENDNKKTIINN